MGLNNIIAKRDQVENSQGNPLSGGTVSLYEPGTTEFIQAFQDSGLITQHTQPISLSGSGRANIWITQDCDLRIEDRNGNLVLTEDNVNPATLGAGESGGLLSNGSFEIDTDVDGTPDNWTLVSESGASNARDTSESTDGTASFRFTSTGVGGGSLTTTSFFPVNEVDDLRIDFDIRSTVAAVRNIVRVEWYDVSQVSISNTDIYDSTSNPTSFTSQSLSATPPALARFAKLRLIGIDPSVALSGITYFDRVSTFYPAVVSGTFGNVEIRDNEIITINANGDLDLNPNGTGEVNITAPLNVTSTVDGRDIDADGTQLDTNTSKLSGIESGATGDQSDAEIRTAVEAATDSNVFTDADHSKLNGIETAATSDQSDAEIRAAVEAATNSNVFTDADVIKFDGIEASATADQSNAEIRTAVGAATNSNVFTDAEQTKLANAAIPIIKSADEEVTNSTALQADDDLLFNVEANATYAVEFFIELARDSGGPIFAFDWTHPASCLFTFGGQLHDASVTFTNDMRNEAASSANHVFGNDVRNYYRGQGVIRNGANAGNFTFEWAQAVLDASNGVIVKKGSWIRYTKL